MAEEHNIEIDMSILMQQEKTTTSLCDKYGVHVFSEEARLLEDALEKREEEQREKILSDICGGTENSGRDEILRAVMAADTQTVIKKDYGAETKENSPLSMYVYGLLGVMTAGIVLFYIESRRKKRRGHEADDNDDRYTEEYL